MPELHFFRAGTDVMRCGYCINFFSKHIERFDHNMQTDHDDGI